MRNRKLAGLSLAVLTVVSFSRCLAAEEGRPNIVLIAFAGVGVGDLSCFGGPVKTPHIDALAAEGVRFTRFNQFDRLPHRKRELHRLLGVGCVV